MEGKGSFIFLSVIVVVLSLCLAGVIGYLFVYGVQKPVSSVTTRKEQTRPIIKDYKKALKIRPFGDEGENINLKIVDDKQIHVVRAGMEILTDDKNAYELMTVRESEIKDMIINEFNNITFDDIKNPQTKQNLKEKILTSLNKMFGNKIADLSFDKWFYQ